MFKLGFDKESYFLITARLLLFDYILSKLNFKVSVYE